MPTLIKDGSVIDNPWTMLDKEAALPSALTHGGSKLIVPLQLWLAHKEALQQSGHEIGVWLDSDDAPESLESDLGNLSLIALNFPSFRDGRAYSSAAILRQRLNFKGELRAVGEVLRDQLFYMKKCGFDSFEMSGEASLEDSLTAFSDFANNYQSTVENPLPLFRRR